MASFEIYGGKPFRIRTYKGLDESFELGATDIELAKKFNVFHLHKPYFDK